MDNDICALLPIESKLVQKTSIEDMKIGDIISCKYTATTSGKIGIFSELGSCNCDEIPRDVSSSTPNGKFFFVKVDDNKLIADRNIQHNISWNELNKENLIDGKILEIGRINDVITVPYGGVAYRDDITISFPNKTLTSNEGDDYTLDQSSDLNGSGFAYLVFNKNIINSSDCWHSAAESNPYIKVSSKMGKIISSGFRLTNRKNTSFPQAPNYCAIYGSNDNENFDKIYETSNLPQDSEAVSYHYFDSQVEYLIYKFSFTSLTGYVAITKLEIFKDYNSKEASLSIINKNKGGWPIINDWDTYIYKSNLNDKIEPGDNSIWNYKSIASITKSTSILSVICANGIKPSKTCIVARGYKDEYIDDDSPKRFDIVPHNHTSSILGFRPMLVIGGDV